MKARTVFPLLTLFLFVFIVGCTPESQTGTAATTPEPTATVIAEGTANAAIVEPTAVPTTVPMEAPADFEAKLKTALVNRDLDSLQSRMSETFGYGFYRSEWLQGTPAEARPQMNAWLSVGSDLQFSPEDTDLTQMLDGQDPFMMMGPDVMVTAVYHTTGWGPAGQDEAMLFVEETVEGMLALKAILYAPNGFVPADSDLPVMDEQAAPVGLLYGKADGSLWQVGADGQPVDLWFQEGATPLLSPDGAHAFYQIQGDLWLVEIASGESRILTKDRPDGEGPDTPLTGNHTWVDGNTILSGVLLNPVEEGGPNYGHPALIEIADGTVTILDEERLMSSSPAVSAEGAIAYSAVGMSADDRELTWIHYPEIGPVPFDTTAFAGALDGGYTSPSWSVDGRYLAWIVSDGSSGQLAVFDLESKTVATLPAFTLAPFGGAIPNPVFGPDASRIALRQFTSDPATTGLWLYTQDGQPPLFVAQNGGEPFWITDNLLLFIHYDENFNGQLQQLDILTGVRSVVTLPDAVRIFGIPTP